MQAGLDNVVAAETQLSTVDGEAGRLIVRGHDIDALAGVIGFEDMAALLWRDLAPGATEPAALRRRLGAARVAVSADIGPFLAASAGLSPIEALRAGLASALVSLLAAAPALAGDGMMMTTGETATLGNLTIEAPFAFATLPNQPVAGGFMLTYFSSFGQTYSNKYSIASVLGHNCQKTPSLFIIVCCL